MIKFIHGDTLSSYVIIPTIVYDSATPKELYIIWLKWYFGIEWGTKKEFKKDKELKNL